MGTNTNDDKTKTNDNNNNNNNHSHNHSDDVVVVVDADGYDDSKIPDVRPLKYGSATPPPTSSSQQDTFNGRSGVWICENCSCKVLLEPGTKQWTCKRCKKAMYTMPKDDNCPLDTFCPCCCWDTILTRN
jgi:hypothetical protein